MSLPIRRSQDTRAVAPGLAEMSEGGALAVMDRAVRRLDELAEQLGQAGTEAAHQLRNARDAVSELMEYSGLLAEVYDAMGAPRGPARIKLDVALNRCHEDAYAKPLADALRRDMGAKA